MNVITKFINSLSNIGKKLLAIALVIVAIALFDLLLISPTLSRMSTIDQEIEKETTNIKQDLHFLSYQDKINAESKAYDPYLTQKASSESETMGAFVRTLEALGKKANLISTKVMPQSAGLKEKEFTKYITEVDCVGNLTDVITFMHMIDTSKELMKVVKFNFTSKKAENDEIKASLTVHKVVILKRD